MISKAINNKIHEKIKELDEQNKAQDVLDFINYIKFLDKSMTAEEIHLYFMFHYNIKED